MNAYGQELLRLKATNIRSREGLGADRDNANSRRALAIRGHGHESTRNPRRP